MQESKAEETVQQQLPHQKLKKLKNALVSAHNAEKITEALTEINQLLTDYTTPDINHVNDLLYDTLKPIARQVTNLYFRDQQHLALMKAIIMKIVRLYVRMFRAYESTGCAQNLKELLSRESFLFVGERVDLDANAAAGQTKQSNMMMQLQQTEFKQPADQQGKSADPPFTSPLTLQLQNLNAGQPAEGPVQQPRSMAAKVDQEDPVFMPSQLCTPPETHEKSPVQSKAASQSKSSTHSKAKQSEVEQVPSKQYTWVHSKKKTVFYRDCVEQIMVDFQGIEQDFPTFKIDTISEFYLLVYYLDDNFSEQKLIELMLKGISSLSEYFSNPSKDLLKTVSKDSLDQLCQTIVKILRVSTDYDTKTYVQLLGAQMSLNLLKQEKIERRMLGIKLLGKYASGIYIRHVQYLSDTEFGKWCLKNQVFEKVYTVDAQLPFLKLSQDIFKLYFRNKLMTAELYTQLFSLLDNCSKEVRRFMFKLLDSVYIRFESSDTEHMVERLSVIRKPQFYDEDFWMYYEDLAKYQCYSQLSKTFEVIRAIVEKLYQSFTPYIKTKCQYTFTKVLMGLLDKNSSPESRVTDSLKLFDQFLEVPCSRTCTIMKRVLQMFPQVGKYSKARLASEMVDRRKFFERVIPILENNPLLKHELLNFIRLLMKHYQEDEENAISIQVMEKLTQYPDIFCELVPFMGTQKADFLQNLVKLIRHHQFPFICIKEVFCLVNRIGMQLIDKESSQRQYQIIVNPNDFKGIALLFQILQTTQFEKVRNECAEFIAYIYTCFEEDYLQQGETILIAFMKTTINKTIDLYAQWKNCTEYDKEWNQIKLKGYLNLLEQLLGYTEILGVGSLKSHSSLVGTGTVVIKINNEYTYGDDVLKSFEKKFPSNSTLFQVLTQVCKLFKCSPTDIALKHNSIHGKPVPFKWNGRILDELNLNQVQLVATKSYRNRLKRAPLTTKQGELTERAKQVFTEMYHIFAQNNKMGKKQCAAYVEGVTKVPCSYYDGRVNNFFSEYCKNKDQNISIQDFLRFYKESSNAKPYVVYKNLKNLRWRRDLRKYDQQIDNFNEPAMLRYYLSRDEQFYDMLFTLIGKDQQQLKNDREMKLLCQKLLQRLPTSPKVMKSVDESFKVSGKSQFETQYILITIQSLLSSTQEQHEQFNKEFIQSDKYLKIYEYLLDNQTQKGQKQDQNDRNKKNVAIALHILRSLINISHLKTDKPIETEGLKSMIKVPHTAIFEQLSHQSLQKEDPEIFEPAVVLLLTQDKASFDWLQNALFHKDRDFRLITCNFLYLWGVKTSFEFDLFKIQEEIKCQEWFNLLEKMIYINQSLNLQEIFNKKLSSVLLRSENLENLSYDPILNGNLRLLRAIFNKIHQRRCRNQQVRIDLPEKYTDQLIGVLQNTISDNNRLLLYELIYTVNPEECLDYMETLIDTIPANKQIQRREHFVGIRNLGSICYMNSIIQQLFVIEDFRNIVMNLKAEKVEQTEVNGKIMVDDTLYQLQKMYAHLLLSQKKFYDPTDFCLTIKDYQGKPINTAIQEDAHEFLSTLFDKIDKYMIQERKKEQNQRGQEKQKQPSLGQQQELSEHEKVFAKTFKGKNIKLITCKSCNNEITRTEQINNLSVQVKNMNSLNDSLEKLIQCEQITEYHCEICNEKVPQTTVQTMLNVLPEVLIINLQRIIFDLTTFQHEKVHTRLDFPHDLDLKNYRKTTTETESQCQYQLQGVVIHSGTSQSGHYYSLIKVNDTWYKFNDQTVTEFDIKLLPGQAFGGNQQADQWGELKFSTNAYILVYRRKNSDLTKSRLLNRMHQETKNTFTAEVEQQNNKFYRALQLHQPSFFVFLNSVYQRIRLPDMNQRCMVDTYVKNWEELIYRKFYERLLQISLKAMKFMTIYYEFRTEVFCSLGTLIFELFMLLPQRAKSFLMDLQTQAHLQVLITHNQALIRQLHFCVLTKALFIFISYDGLIYQSAKKVEDLEMKQDQMKQHEMKQDSKEEHMKSMENQDQNRANTKVLQILESLMEKPNSELVRKNIFKSNYFFELIKFLSSWEGPMRKFVMDHDLLGNLLDLMMGNDSPFKKVDQKRVEFPSPQSLPVMQTIVLLQQNKETLVEIPQYEQGRKLYPMSEKEKRILGDMGFYRKMFKDRHDQSTLSPLITRMCSENREFSIKMAELLLTSLSNLDSYEHVMPIFSHIKYLLLLSDSLAHERMKWLLGIYQMESLTKLDYTMRDSTASQSVIYVSPIFFIGSEQYQPLLQRLYEKRQRFDLLPVTGLLSLLEVMCTHDPVAEYMISIPPPCYNMVTFLDWIQNYAYRLCHEEHYGIAKSDRETWVEKLKTHIDVFKKKLQGRNLPTLKNIIGKNANLTPLHSFSTPDYQITVWEHDTYILPNLPTGNSNEALPSSLFVMGKPIQHAKYFVHSYNQDNLPPNPDLKTEKTLLTFQIDTKRKLRLTFNSQSFQNQIIIGKGQIDINMPFDPKPPSEFIIIEALEQLDKQMQQENSRHKYDTGQQQIVINGPIALPDMERRNGNFMMDQAGYVEDMGEQIPCPECTYLNSAIMTKCEVCETYLRK